MRHSTLVLPQAIGLVRLICLQARSSLLNHAMRLTSDIIEGSGRAVPLSSF